MSVKSYFSKLQIHPLLYFFMFVSFFTGTFLELAIILLIVFIHEFGHYLAAYYYKWRIDTIALWVFGGVMKTDEYGTRKIFEEFVVTIAGPLQHLIIYLCIIGLSLQSFIPEVIIFLLFYYNTIILLFNLLPIWPLDGGKLFFLLNSIFFPYRQAYEQTILFSMIMCLMLIIMHLLLWPFNLSSLLIISFLLIENGKDWQQRYYVFIRFLLQRYEQPKNIQQLTPIIVSKNLPLKQVFQKFYQGKKHLIHVIDPLNDQTIIMNERDCLRLYFDKKYLQQPIGELMT
ncbi:MAG TPA: site-2 protease family protein [Bacillota bacterium]|nr:site-2 protease family protein [Bacillota bacterium]